MSVIWSEESKFQHWLQVELAVLEAISYGGDISREIFEDIQSKAGFSVARITEIEAETHHDLLAFVQCVQESLDPILAHFFHADLTSYDVEEPATALMIKRSSDIILRECETLKAALVDRAKETQSIICIDRTHGQHAEPTVFAVHFLRSLDSLIEARVRLEQAAKSMEVGKISGAVGTYAGRLSPHLETWVLHQLGLHRVRITGQIIPRDRHAALLHALALVASVVENLALQIRLLGQTEVGEVQEPFSQKQKGSSRMPHKKNTILTENLCGLSRLVKGYAQIAMDNIPTWGARDISQSSVERVIFPDAFQVVHFMLRRMTRVISGLVIRPDRIAHNLDMTHRTFFSGEVKEALLEAGMDAEAAYRVSQSLAFRAMETGQDYAEVLMMSEDVPPTVKDRLNKIFDLRRFLHHIPTILDRFNISA